MQSRFGQNFHVAAAALSSLLAAGALPSTASATTILFSDRGAFETATGATGIGAIPFSNSVASFSIGDVTFLNDPPSTVNRRRNWSTLISEPFDLAINNVENFDVAFATPVYSFGFDFHEPSTPTPPGPSFPDTCNTTPCVDSTFEVRLVSGVSTVATFSFTRPDDILAFVGVWSSVGFDRAEIRETVGTLDNEFFGNFMTGATPFTVPEPSTLALLGTIALGLALRRRPPRAG